MTPTGDDRLRGVVVGYARVSTLEQNPDLQVDALTRAGAVRVFTDHASGATSDRPQLAACLDYLRPGDVLAVWRLDRLGRSVTDLIDLVGRLHRADVQFRSLTEGIDTTSPVGEFTFHLLAALAQMERRVIQERTRAGLAAARTRGRRGGRPSVMSTQRREQATRMRAELDAEGRPRWTLQDIAETLGVSRSSIVRALRGQP